MWIREMCDWNALSVCVCVTKERDEKEPSEQWHGACEKCTSYILKCHSLYIYGVDEWFAMALIFTANMKMQSRNQTKPRICIIYIDNEWIFFFWKEKPKISMGVIGCPIGIGNFLQRNQCDINIYNP